MTHQLNLRQRVGAMIALSTLSMLLPRDAVCTASPSFLPSTYICTQQASAISILHCWLQCNKLGAYGVAMYPSNKTSPAYDTLDLKLAHAPTPQLINTNPKTGVTQLLISNPPWLQRFPTTHTTRYSSARQLCPPATPYIPQPARAL